MDYPSRKYCTCNYLGLAGEGSCTCKGCPRNEGTRAPRAGAYRATPSEDADDDADDDARAKPSEDADADDDVALKRASADADDDADASDDAARWASTAPERAAPAQLVGWESPGTPGRPCWGARSLCQRATSTFVPGLRTPGTRVPGL